MPSTTSSASRSLNANDYRTLALAALGGALEFYDFVVFVFFTKALSAVFFPPQMSEWLRQLQTFGIGTRSNSPLTALVDQNILVHFKKALPCVQIGIFPQFIFNPRKVYIT